jgi:hypothetical protein
LREHRTESPEASGFWPAVSASAHLEGFGASEGLINPED